MGNELSSSEVEEDQEENTADINPQVGVEVQNGPVTLQSSQVIHAAPHITQESSKGTILQENIVSSSQKTIVISPISNGIDAKPPAQPAKSKFRLTISRPAPGQTAFQPNGPENGEVMSEVRVEEPAPIQSQNKAPVTVETSLNMGGGPNQAPSTGLLTDNANLSQNSMIEVESSPAKPKEVSIFQRLFKPEKKAQTEEPGGPENQDVVININQDGGLQSAPPSASLQIQNADKGNQAAVDGQSSEPASVPVGPESSTEATQASPQPEIHPVMSFFKTLVNKPGTRSEEETKPDKEDKKKENGGLRKSSSKKKEKGKSATLQAPEKEVKGQKKAESSKSSTLGRLFRPKSKKDEVQASGDKITASADDGKSPKEAAARPRLFWRKSSTEQDSQSAKPDSGAKSSPTTEGKSQQGKKAEEGKNSKPKIMMFFKQLTLDITDGVEVGKSEKTVVTAVVEPPPAPPLQKTKENPKDKKGSSEKLAKQESRESPEAAASSQAQAVEASSGQDGAEYSKEGQMKRVEKRQSLGNFFKAMGPRRLCDAEVQTDPVSILPAEKAK